MSDKVVMLTEEDAAAHIANGGFSCPNPQCDGDDIDVEPLDADSGGVTQDSTCRSCGVSWRDSYELVGFCQLEPVEWREAYDATGAQQAAIKFVLERLERVANVADTARILVMNSDPEEAERYRQDSVLCHEALRMAAQAGLTK